MSVVRRATPDDLAALIALEEAAFADPWSAAGLQAELELRHARSWVIDVQDGLAASLLGWLLFEELHVNRVAVRPEMRRRGLGRAVLLHAMAAARQEGAQRALLEVRADNTGALALYLETGFRRAGLRRGYYADGADAVLMTADLHA